VTAPGPEPLGRSVVIAPGEDPPEHTEAPPHELGPGFSLLRERLTKVVWHNPYDAAGPGPGWIPTIPDHYREASQP
jgi:hypothetical protein